jgi:hypothetical protein
VAKVSADGSKLLYFTALSGSCAEAAAAIALGSDDSSYVTGSTGSSDFPVTADAMLTTFRGRITGVSGEDQSGWRGGYSSYYQRDIIHKSYPGYPVSSGQPAQRFILKLDAGLNKLLLSIYAYGGG